MARGMSRSNTEDFIEGVKKVLYKKTTLKLNKETVKKPIDRQCLACLLDRAQAGRTSRWKGLGRIRRSYSVSSCFFPSPVPLEKHLVERSALACVVYSHRAEAVEHLPHTCTTQVHVTVATIPGHLVESGLHCSTAPLASQSTQCSSATCLSCPPMTYTHGERNC